ncbi:MAG: PIG-L family deacetylase [Prolixibacteraceae bacterium]|nr:PIG-L family deacetylase [Prolixibacteraceae bacterium]
MKFDLSGVEQSFFAESGIKNITTEVPYIVVENFPKLGLLSSLRFFEFINNNPEGVISLPTGKTAQYFLSFTQKLLENWEDKQGKVLLEKYGLGNIKKPDLRGLRFVQTGEFYPIDSSQHNSLYNYALKYYVEGLGLDPEKSLLINSDDIKLSGNKHFTEVFPDYKIDLSLRYREATSHCEKIQQESLFKIDDWCTDYENKIREKGGIGFFLGGIGPDGHIGFNTKGSDHFSSTRLTSTNFETQAVVAGDLGGIEVSRNRLVITIGLGTITYNPDCTAVIYAAGEAIADTICDSLQNKPSNSFPATSLQKLKNSRFYLTRGAAVKLDDSINSYYHNGPWSHSKTERAVIDLCKRINKFGSKLTVEDLKKDKYCSLIPGLNDDTVQTVVNSVTEKIEKGMAKHTNQVYYHTGPHHDDIMLGIMPLTTRQRREPTNSMHFSVMTSGFTAVTNKFLIDLLNDTKNLIRENKIEMVNYPDFFVDGYMYKWDKDVYHYLDNIAANDEEEKRRGVCHRLVRCIVDIWKVRDKEQLRDTIYDILSSLKSSYDGSKNPPKIQKLKGMIRELEEELVWAHYGVRVKNVHHLRLGFYQGSLFASKPDTERDILPILEDFRKYKPTVISLAMDPQGSGPDTHYKVLQAIAGAVQEWGKEEDLSGLRIHGYRNVWFRYHPSDVEVIVPVSLNALATLEKSFEECYVTQVNASFPSYQLDGKFSTLTQKIWVEQHKQIQLLLGKNFFYQSNNPLLRATHGLIYMRDLNVDQFLEEAFALEKSMEGIF